jgi:hypothetical protein
MKLAPVILIGVEVALMSTRTESPLSSLAVSAKHLKPRRGHADGQALSGEWNDDDYDVPSDDAVVGRILQVHAAPMGTPWMWTLPRQLIHASGGCISQLKVHPLGIS